VKKLPLIEWLNLLGNSIHQLINRLQKLLQIVFWKFQGQGIYHRNRRKFKEYGWSLTGTSVNWGDLLLREIADEFFDLVTIRKEYAGAVFGGSVLSEYHFEHFQKNTSSRPVLAVSCGARNSRESLEPPLNLEIHGVRGHCTAALLKNTVPTGDPGMLAPIIFGIEPKLSNEFRKLHVPHYSQPKNRIDFHAESLSTMLPFGKSSKSLVSKINSSNFVLAGSLHAGICAFACGTPFAFSLADSSEDTFKFYDFAQFYGINIVFQEDFKSAIRWYLNEDTLHLDRAPKDFEIYSSSLSEYVKYDLNIFRSKVEIHIKSRKSIHALKVKSLTDYLKRGKLIS
jgi:hypothetical protein